MVNVVKSVYCYKHIHDIIGDVERKKERKKERHMYKLCKHTDYTYMYQASNHFQSYHSSIIKELTSPSMALKVSIIEEFGGLFSITK